MNLEFLRELIIPASTKIAMIVLDGLGGLPLTPDGKTELETARTPNLDALAARSALGLSVPLGPGITVESGPGHLALFGYDPLHYRIGRGVLEALGIEFDLQPNHVAARGNFCTMNDAGIVTDRRAGRIPTEASKELARLLTMRIDDVEIFVEVVKEHRLAIVLRGAGLGAAVSGSDPLKNGAPPHPVRALAADSDKTARVVNQFIERARQLLADNSPANMLLVRGLDRYPNFPAFPEVFGLRAAAIAIAPTYRGIARLVGMHILPVNGSTFADEFATLEQHWNDFDFFYLHIKNTDLASLSHPCPSDKNSEEIEYWTTQVGLPKRAGAKSRLSRRGRRFCAQGARHRRGGRVVAAPVRARTGCGDRGRRSFDARRAACALVASCACVALQSHRSRRWHRRVWRARLRARIAGRVARARPDAARAGARAAHQEI